MSTWLASHPTALTELLGQATRPLPTQLPHPPSSTFCPLGPLHPGSPISSHSLERPTQVANPSPHHTPVSVRAYPRTHTHAQARRHGIPGEAGFGGRVQGALPQASTHDQAPQARGLAACPSLGVAS